MCLKGIYLDGVVPATGDKDIRILWMKLCAKDSIGVTSCHLHLAGIKLHSLLLGAFIVYTQCIVGAGSHETRTVRTKVTREHLILALIQLADFLSTGRMPVFDGTISVYCESMLPSGGCTSSRAYIRLRGHSLS